ncbi:PucR family transcriptional regulator [Rhodococcus sp. NPDC056960]|uniref:PucR family transcriptional regulator n=1 Tax=Rhodococcus TaxID=1827 RepID=UPI003636E68D
MTTSASWIRGLRVPEDEVLPPVCTEASVAPIRALVGADAVNWAVRVAADAAFEPVTGSVGLAGGHSLATVQRLGVELGCLSMLESLYRGKPTPPFLNADGNRYIADLIQRRVPLARLLTQIRQGHAYIADQLMDACRDLLPAHEHAEELQRISRVLFEYVEGLVTEVEPAFAAAEKDWGASVYAARAKALEHLLQGDETELDDAGRRLSYDIAHRYHVGIAVYNETPDESDALLVEAARHVLAVLGATQTLIVPRGLMTLWAWGNSSARLDVRLLQGFSGLRILVGRLGYGPAGFRRSHEQALEAHRIAQRRRTSGPSIFLFDDISLLSLLLKNPEEAAEFAAFELGDLMKDDPKTADLRLTLRTYLENHSPNTTATKLHIARNTVTYRLRRASEILGRPLEERQLETWTALVLHEYTSDPPQFE